MRTLRSKLVVSTVLLAAAVMVVLVVGTQAVLELTARRDVRAALSASPEQAAAAYERSERYALLVTCALAVVVVALVGWLAWSLTRRALAPVQQMAERAADWSEHDLEHRFDLGPPVNELAALGATLDRLLDRVAQAILTEQRLTAELAHELRTPLTAIAASAEIAQLRHDGDPALREDLAEIGDGARRMAQVITTLLEVARSPETARGAARSSVRDVVEAMAAHVPERVRFTTDLAAGLPLVAAPAHLVSQALAPLVENAGRHAASAVALSAEVVADRVEIAVRDDGGGVPAEQRLRIFEPGTSNAGGTGLGLGIARRVARSVGGDVVLSAVGADEGSTVFVLRLPRS
ncbi:HAMP domain-containing sensor histidine kinase [Nocardioides sp. CER19]|uniref:HAMP domain-containing sensor histidine kinase n=1 Tax=Nocardioides sp. CER19 TaxID=3038538 RepID=UPI00244A84FB|nr:HAMP domain-containing sensor histidine kinase [Nocardioides sp. CER19]MDH2413025.1 HAMP domain-containing sensor histidine kinase [Nocardioides sp. CER19]